MISTAYRYVRPALPWKDVEIEGFRIIDRCIEWPATGGEMILGVR